MQLRRNQASGNQRLRFGGEGDTISDFSDIERLDAERITRQQNLPRRAIMNGDAIHAAQKLSEARAIAESWLRAHPVPVPGAGVQP